MASTRPYFVTHKGIRRLVEATGPAEAASHVVAAEISELRAARGAEVAEWYKLQRPVDTAGSKEPLSAGVPTAPLLQHQPITEARQNVTPFTADHAHSWLIAKLMPLDHRVAQGVLEIWDAMHRRGTMEQHDLQALRALWPDFIEIMAAGHGRSMIELEISAEESFDFQDVVNAIERAARREQFGHVAPTVPTAGFLVAGVDMATDSAA